VIKRDVGRVLMTLETIQENKLADSKPKDKPVEPDDAERRPGDGTVASSDS